MASRIHPTAVLDASAEIGEDVEIGPYCVIHAGVRLGDGCWLQNHVTLAGPLTVGAGNRFFAFGSIGQQTQDLKYKGEPTFCEIGQGNTFREFVTVHRGTGGEDKTVIGSHNNFLAYAHIAHDCKVGNHCIFSNNATLAGHVTVGDHVILGGLSAVHQFCHIGRGAMTGGCTKIVQDLPPHMIADGNPASVRSVNSVGMQRHGYSEAAVRVVKEAHRSLWRKDLNTPQALEELRAMEDVDGLLAEIIHFVGSSSRGIIR